MCETEDIFEKPLSFKEICIVSKDIMHIRINYFKERGFKNIKKMTQRRVLMAAKEWFNGGYLWKYERCTFKDWKEFVKAFDEEGIEFLEIYAWL